MSNRVRTVLVVIIALVWSANFTTPIFVHEYKPADSINVLFMAVMAAILANRKKTNGDDNEQDEDPKPKRKKPEEVDQ